MRGLPCGPALSRFHVVVLVILVACAVPVYGHHSFAGAYFESDSVTIDGQVDEFVYRAPHAWLYVVATDPQGRQQRYGAEWGSPSRLENEGVAKDTFQVGDQVSITGAPARNQSVHQIHLKKVTRFSRGRWNWEGRQGPR